MIWKGGPGVGNANTWNTNPSWVTAQPTATATARFDGTANVGSIAPNIGTTATSVGSILFADGTSNALSYNISGTSTLTIGSATVAGILHQSVTSQTFSVATIALGFAQAWDVASSGNLSVSSNVSSAGNILTLRGSSTGTGTISGAVTGTGSVVKNGSGAWLMSGANNYSGGTTVNAGTLRFSGANTSVGNVTVATGAVLEIGASNTLPAATGLTLSGGTLALTGNFNQTFTSGLNLTAGTTSTIDFGTPGSANTISFGSSGGNWTSGTSLTVANYTFGSDQLRFGTSATGLSSVQLNDINFTGFAPGAEINAAGFVTPMSAVPEPSTYAALAGVMALAVAGYRRRKARARAAGNETA